MVEDKNPSQDTVEITEHVVIQNVSYDKDVVEIKLPDAVDSGNYGGNFVKDVCVDEGALLRWKISEENPVDKRTSPDYGFQMIDANSDIRFGKKEDARKPVHEIKPETVVPVDSAPPDWNEKQYSSDKEYDLEGRFTTCEIEGDPSDKKISLQELLRLESEEESRQAGTINSESTEKFKRPLHEDEVGQVSTDEFHEVQAIGVRSSVVSKDNSTGCLPTTSPDHDAAAALDVREPNKIDRHNLFIDQRSLEETSEPECSIPEITGASSTESICTADRTDSFSNVVSGSTGLNIVGTAELGSGVVDALSSSSSDIQSCGKSDDRSESISSCAIADAAATSPSPSSFDAEPSDADGKDQEKRASDGAADVHDSDQIDEEGHCIDDTDNAGAGKSSSAAVQDDPGAEQTTAPGSSKSAAALISRFDPFEPNFCSASIMSGPVSMSGHIAYSGSVSLRSDSSTTSTRSFAFPVLQREWVSSPVRMAKAERRHTLRRRAWRKGLICCKF